MSTEAILQALNERGVRYVVIGGVAAVAHGSAYLTDDTDICYQPSPENRERLARYLADLHAWLRGGGPELPFVMDARTLQDSPVLTLVTDEGWFDVMDRVQGIGEYADVEAASQNMVVFGVPTRVLSVGALIASKRATRRVRDEAVAVELEALYAKIHGREPPRVREPRRPPRHPRRRGRA